MKHHQDMPPSERGRFLTKSKSDIIIGLECHIQLNTKSKLFCGCPTSGSEEPNTRTCDVCLGFPGSKPVINKLAVEHAIKLCLALNCRIKKELVFSRKSYFYPDMAKNYQISQYEKPLGEQGRLRLSSGKEIEITRLHIEEDPAALIHPLGMASSQYVLVDYNRSGNPLVEVVSQPELTSPEESREFMRQLISILDYMEIFDINKCILRADVNISVKESNYTRVEIKNIMGFKEIEKALFYEIKRQKNALREGSNIIQETRAWDSEKGITISMRVKEAEEDYGYIIEPDLPIIDITPELVSKIKKGMPELAQDKVSKFIKNYKLNEGDAEVLAQEKLLAELFEKVALEINPNLAAKWLRRELLRVLHYNKKELRELKIDENHIIDLLKFIESKKITDATGKRILERLIKEPFEVKDYIKKEGAEALFDENDITRYCREAIKENPKAAEDFKKGEKNAINYLIGKVMAKTKGKAGPKEVNEILLKLL